MGVNMKIAIVGSRNYKNLNAVTEYIKALPSDTIIVSGGARGVDIRAEIDARRRGLEVMVFYPEWGKYGKSAGMIRNGKIVEECDQMVAFHDGQSKGTLNSINRAKAAGKPVEVINDD